MVKGASQAMGLKAIAEDIGAKFAGPIQINADASAAIGIGSRLGVGKVRHIEVNQLWIQEKVREGRIQLVKVDGIENLADALTKCVESDMLDKHIRGNGGEVIEGRHEVTPEVQSSEEESRGQEEAVEDQEKDQLGHLGCLSHLEYDHNNYQHNNIDDSRHNNNRHNNNQTKVIEDDEGKTTEEEREGSYEEGSSGLITPRGEREMKEA